MGALEPPRLTKSQVASEAERFLEEHNPEREIPFDIERVVEQDLDINIVPIHNLIQAFDVESGLSLSNREIYIDYSRQEERFIRRYRFTLAHECGHLVLHEDAFRSVDVTSVSDYVSVHQAIDDTALEWFERQANWFAGRVLVPREELTRACVEVVSEHTGVLDWDMPIDDYRWPYVSKAIGDRFQVSQDCAWVRIKDERVYEELPQLAPEN